MLLTTYINREAAVQTRIEKGPKPVGTEERIESIVVALYSNATDYPTGDHLPLRLDKCSL